MESSKKIISPKQKIKKTEKSKEEKEGTSEIPIIKITKKEKGEIRQTDNEDSDSNIEEGRIKKEKGKKEKGKKEKIDPESKPFIAEPRKKQYFISPQDSDDEDENENEEDEEEENKNFINKKIMNNTEEAILDLSAAAEIPININSISINNSIALDLSAADHIQELENLILNASHVDDIDASEISIHLSNEILLKSDIKIDDVSDLKFLLGDKLTINNKEKLKNKKIELSLRTLLEHSNYLFDSLYFLSNYKKINFKIKIVKNVEKIEISEYQKSIFIFYVIVMLRGNADFFDNKKLNMDDLPSFLEKNCYVKKLDIKRAKEILCSFSYKKINLNWVLKIDLAKMNEKIKNRFIQGIAGQRMLKLFSKILPSKNLTDKEKELFNILFSISLNVPFAILHPANKSTDTYASFTNNLINFALDVYTEDEIEFAKKHKLIADRKFVKNANYIGYKTWDKNDMKNVFSENMLKIKTDFDNVYFKFDNLNK